MTDAHQIPNSISWHEGMLLSPQHFQEMDRRYEGLFRFHGAHLSSYHWGVINWQLDESLLASGVFRINSVEAVMPDGLAVAFKDEGSRHLQIDLQEQFEALRAKPEKVYLAVITESEGGSGDVGELRRFFSTEGEPVADWNTGDGAVRIPRMVPDLRLIVGQPSKLYTSFPIAELKYRDNMLTLNEFCPPVLAVDKDLEIGRICERLITSLRRKANHLAGVLASGEHAGVEMIRETEQTLYHLVAGLPQFEAVLASERPHPFQVYLALVNLMGQLVTLGKKKVPPQLKPYNHMDLVATYRQIDHYILGVLQERIQETYSLELFRREGDLYTIRFKSEWKDKDLVLGYTKESGTSDRDAISWVNGALVGGRIHIQDLRQRRVLGVTRNHSDKVPGLVPPESMLLFPLDEESSWITLDDDLVVSPSASHAGSLKPINLSLFIRNPERGGGRS